MAPNEPRKIHIGVQTASPRDGGFGRPGLMAQPLVELTQKLGGRIADIEEVAKRGKEVLPNLITILQMGTDYNKACALACMIKMAEEGTECREAIPELRGLMASPIDYVRGYAATLLGKMKDAESIPALVKGLGDRSHIMKWRCAGALHEMGAPAVDALAAKLKDGGLMEKIEARRVLEAIHRDAPESVPEETMGRVAEQKAHEEKLRTKGAQKAWEN